MELLDAARAGNINKIESLLRHGADVHFKSLHTTCTAAVFSSKTHAFQSETACTALHWAARYNQVAAIKILLDAHASINAQDNIGYTPLHWAVFTGSKEAAVALLRSGADLTIQSKKGETPRQLTHDPDFLSLLLEADMKSGLILSDMVRTISMEEEPWERQLPPSGTSMFIDTEPPASVRERSSSKASLMEIDQIGSYLLKREREEPQVILMSPAGHPSVQRTPPRKKRKASTSTDVIREARS